MLRSRNWLVVVLMTAMLFGGGCVFKPRPWHVTGVQSPHAPTPDFSMTWIASDPNGIPLNPEWAAQRDHNQLPPVPNDEDMNKCVRRPDSRDCTAQDTTIDKPPVIGWGLLCSLVPGSQIHGHVDWLPATYTGYLRWIHMAADSDYNFSLFRADDDNGLTQNNQTYNSKRFIEVEFDSREVSDRFSTSTWQKFVGAAGSSDFRDMRQWLNLKSPETPPNTVITGLFNLDCEHDCRSEMHPVYALAVETNDSSADDTWAIFVRNWGNGGSCSGYNHQLELTNNQISVLLPSMSTKEAKIALGTIEFAVSNPDIQFPDMAFIPGTGYVLSFKLGAPKDRPLAELVLHLQWPTGTPSPPRPKLPLQAREYAAQAPEESAENYLSSLFEQVGAQPPTKTELMTEAAAPARDKIVPAPASVKVKIYAPPLPPKPPAPGQTLPRVASVTDEVKLSRDQAVFRKLCAAYRAKGQTLPTDKIQRLPELCESSDVK
ncbi:MAG TPA: hypothetical protein VJP02_05655 [Candidatus Sulfotelmatobacter sp.]|nr:hypothetical protein [Candidatus Sulfotelmatobacter sp.]